MYWSCSLNDLCKPIIFLECLADTLVYFDEIYCLLSGQYGKDGQTDRGKYDRGNVGRTNKDLTAKVEAVEIR